MCQSICQSDDTNVTGFSPAFLIEMDRGRLLSNSQSYYKYERMDRFVLYLVAFSPDINRSLSVYKQIKAVKKEVTNAVGICIYNDTSTGLMYVLVEVGGSINDNQICPYEQKYKKYYKRTFNYPNVELE